MRYELSFLTTWFIFIIKKLGWKGGPGPGPLPFILYAIKRINHGEETKVKERKRQKIHKKGGGADYC
jgi:hypothetical protein